MERVEGQRAAGLGAQRLSVVGLGSRVLAQGAWLLAQGEAEEQRLSVVGSAQGAWLLAREEVFPLFLFLLLRGF